MTADRTRRGAAALVLALLVLAGCGKPSGSPENEIGAMIDDAARAVQAGDLETLQAFISSDYEDGEGRDRRTAAFLLRSWLGRYPDILVAVSNVRIQPISSELATADMMVSLLARESGRPLLAGIDADRLYLRLALRRESGEWRVTRADWGERSPGGSGFSN